MVSELQPGTVVAGRYRLERRLGEGGMGTVWEATHTITLRRHALKFLKASGGALPEMRRRFVREARAASAVDHPNVVTITDVFELSDGAPVMVMDLLEGETLGARIAREGALSLDATAAILLQVVSAVGTAQAAGFVHRDLKPDNVFLRESPTGPSALVLDFGIAKWLGTETRRGETGLVTATGTLLGTPCYMAPEQGFGEKDIDHRADAWAIGVILYECLSGVRPVEGDNLGQVLKRLMNDGITPIETIADVPEDVAHLVGRLLKRERAERADLMETFAVLSRYTDVSAPEFGPPGSRPATEPSSGSLRPEEGAPARSEHNTARTENLTAGPTSMPVLPLERRRLPYAIAAGVVLGGIGLATWSGRPTAETAPDHPALASVPEPREPVANLAPARENPPSSPTAVSAPPSASAPPLEAAPPARTKPLTPRAWATPSAPTEPGAPPAETVASSRSARGLVEKPPF